MAIRVSPHTIDDISSAAETAGASMEKLRATFFVSNATSAVADVASDSGDIIAISDTAKIKYSAMSSGSRINLSALEQKTSYGQNISALTSPQQEDATAAQESNPQSGKDPSALAKDRITEMQKRIAEVQKQLGQATQELQAATAASGSTPTLAATATAESTTTSATSSDDATNAAQKTLVDKAVEYTQQPTAGGTTNATPSAAQSYSDNESAGFNNPDLKKIQVTVMELSDKLMQLKTELQKAMKQVYGGGDAGWVPGIRCQGSPSSLSGSPSVRHIGETVDPYAAAAAAEAAEKARGAAPEFVWTKA